MKLLTVYNDSSMDAFMQVTNMDTLVPGVLRSHDSSKFQDTQTATTGTHLAIGFARTSQFWEHL